MAIHQLAPTVPDTRPRWSRVVGISMACIVHGVMFGLLLLAPRVDTPAHEDDPDPPLVFIEYQPEPEPPPPPPAPEVIPPPATPPPPVQPAPFVSPPPVLETAPDSPIAIPVDPEPPMPPVAPPVPDGGPSVGADYRNRKGLVYPRQALVKREQGTVMLRVYVNPDGSPGQVELHGSSGSRHLDQAATRAVKSWRFRPGTRDGQPVGGWVMIPVDFHLND